MVRSGSTHDKGCVRKERSEMKVSCCVLKTSLEGDLQAEFNYFVACSDRTVKEPPKFFRQAEEKLARLQAKASLRKGLRLLGNLIKKLLDSVSNGNL